MIRISLIVIILSLAVILLLRRNPEKTEAGAPSTTEITAGAPAARSPVARPTAEADAQAKLQRTAAREESAVARTMADPPAGVDAADRKWISSLAISDPSRTILASSTLLQKSASSASPNDLALLAETFANEVHVGQKAFLADLPTVLMDKDNLNPERTSALLAATSRLDPNDSEAVRQLAKGVLDPRSAGSQPRDPVTNETYKDAAISYVLSSPDRAAALKEIEALADPANPGRARILTIIRQQYVSETPR